MKYTFCFLLYSLTALLSLSASEVPPNKLGNSGKLINSVPTLADSTNTELSSSPISSSPGCYLYSFYDSACKATAQTLRFREKQTPEGQQNVLGIADPKLIGDKTYQTRLKQEQERNKKSYVLMAIIAQNPSMQLSVDELDLYRSGTNRMQLGALWFQNMCQSQIGLENALTQEQRAIQMLKLHAQPYLLTITMFLNSGIEGQKNLRDMMPVAPVIPVQVVPIAPKQLEKQNEAEKKQELNPQEPKPEDNVKNGQEDNKNEENKKEQNEKSEDNKIVREEILLESILKTIEELQHKISLLDPTKSQQKYIPQ